MGHKIFTSYKYADDNVYNIHYWKNCTVRDYVDEFESKLDSTNHIFKGESDGEDLSKLSDETIWQKLRDRIYDSTLTIVFISPNMKETNKTERNQWIPWEVSYSVKATSRKDKNGNPITSKTNAMIAVVLPDSNNSYSYYLESKSCCSNPCTMHYTNKLFTIIKKNKFNEKDGSKRTCINNDTIWTGEPSYIKAVRWDNFIININYYIDKAYERQDSIDNYEIMKEV